MSKKLPAQLQKVLNEHKQKWLIDNDELAKRLTNATSLYTKGLPKLGNTKSHALIIMHYKNLNELIEGVTGSYNGYEVSIKHTTPIVGGNGYKVGFIKPLAVQDNDLEIIEKEVKTQYQNELDEIKESFVNNLLNEYEQQQSSVKQAKEADNQQKLKDSILNLLD